MATKTTKVTIPEDVRDHIQSLQYEVESRKDLLAHMINTGTDIDSEPFKKYEKEYQEFFVQYNVAKEAMQKNLLEPAVQTKLISWNLDFESCEVTCVHEG